LRKEIAKLRVLQNGPGISHCPRMESQSRSNGNAHNAFHTPHSSDQICGSLAIVPESRYIGDTDGAMEEGKEQIFTIIRVASL
jgi:hypothetical protein